MPRSNNPNQMQSNNEPQMTMPMQEAQGVNGITGVNIYPQAKSQMNLQMTNHMMTTNPISNNSNAQLNNLVAKFENIQKTGKSQR